MVVESRSISDAEMKKNFLEQNGLQSIVQNLGMRARSRGAIRVFVPIPEYLRAKNLLEEVEQVEPTIDGINNE